MSVQAFSVCHAGRRPQGNPLRGRGYAAALQTALPRDRGERPARTPARGANPHCGDCTHTLGEVTMLNESTMNAPAEIGADVSTHTRVPLDAIVPSTTHVQAERRRLFDAHAMNELASSIRNVGVVQPIVVRPLEQREGGVGFEIVAGERRWEAAKAAGLADIPVVVRGLDDAAVLEIQLIENLQREGLDELTEAEGYGELLKAGLSAEDLAAKLAKSTAYVYQRLKLLALCREGRKAFREGVLLPSIALLVARIPDEKLQKEALDEVTRKDWQGDRPNFREAQSIILNRYMLRLDQAPFDTKDATLFPPAGACTDCPKRTGNQPQLFADVKRGDTCTDPTCFATKKVMNLARERKTALDAGRRVIEGEEASAMIKRGTWDLKGHVDVDSTCFADEKQRTYRKILGKQLPPVALLLDESRGRWLEVVPRADIDRLLKDKGLRTAQIKSDGGNQKQREAEKKAKEETQFRTWLLQQVREKAPSTADLPMLRAVAEAFYGSIHYDARKRLARLYRWKQPTKDGPAAPDSPWGFMPTATTADVTRFLLDCALVGEVHASTWSTAKPKQLLAAAERAGLSVAKLRKEFDPKVHAGELKTATTPAKLPKRIGGSGKTGAGKPAARR